MSSNSQQGDRSGCKEVSELRKLWAIVNSMTDGLIIFDLDGNVLDMNPESLRIHKYKDVSDANKHLSEFSDMFRVYSLDGRLLPVEEWPIVRVLRGEAFRNYEVRVHRTDINHTWIGSYSGTPVTTESGNVSLGVITLRDITEQKRAEEAQRESEARYRDLVENANSAIIRWRSNGTITFFNEFAQRFFGYSEEEAIGKPVSMLVPETESTGTDLKGLAQDILAHPERYVNNVNENIRRDGSRVWMTWSNRPVFDMSGNVVEIFAVGSDITEQRELEAHKREFYRRTIEAATNGKLLICERNEIEQAAGPAVKTWEIHGKDDSGTAMDEVVRFTRGAGMDEQRTYEFLGCVIEATTNALKHAGGGNVSLHKVDNRLICVVSDSGPGIGAMALPDVALTNHYSTAGTLGMGYKLMIQFADKVYLATGPEGTTVAVEMTVYRDLTQQQASSPLRIEGWN